MSSPEHVEREQVEESNSEIHNGMLLLALACHMLAGTIKDIVTRYAHGKGNYVERQFGLDTPFKNLIVNGLAEDRQKIAKSKKNYLDPLIVVNKYCADALRLYLINCPVVKAESLKFKK